MARVTLATRALPGQGDDAIELHRGSVAERRSRCVRQRTLIERDQEQGLVAPCCSGSCKARTQYRPAGGYRRLIIVCRSPPSRNNLMPEDYRCILNR